MPLFDTTCQGDKDTSSMPQHRPRELTPQEARERGIAPGFTVSVNPEEYHHVRTLMTLAGITDGGGSGTVCEPFTFDQV